jgi:hypothetical protein
MTTASSILAVVALPLNLLLYSHLAFKNNDDKKTEIKWSEFSISLGVVISGIILGLYLSYKLEENIQIEVEERRSSIRTEDGELVQSFIKIVPNAESNGADASADASVDAPVDEPVSSSVGKGSYQEQTASMNVPNPVDKVRRMYD